MFPFASAVVCWAACGLSVGAAPPQAPPSPGLRTFAIEKSAAERKVENDVDMKAGLTTPPALPEAHESIHATVGVGYVQGADWGSQVLANGAFAGLQLQFDSLVTKGRQGLMLNAGTLLVSDPDARWRGEAGDLFSRLRGAARGGRVTWSAWGDRSPSIAVYSARPGLPSAPTVAAYRDQLRIGGQTLLDAEVGSDRSHVLESRLGGRRFDLNLAYRVVPGPIATRDRAAQASAQLWRGVRVSGGVWQSTQAGEPSKSRTVAVRIPFARRFDLTLERSFVAAGSTASRSWAAMGGIHAGSWQFFHRYQQGSTDVAQAAFNETMGREDLQSMAAYGPNPRVNLTLQLATQWSRAGPPQRWEELQAIVKLTRSTTLQAVSAIPDVFNAQRLRARVVQNLPHHYSIEAEYGRLSAFQDGPDLLDRSRVRVMLRKSLDIKTPARGGDVHGRVVDQTGRPVGGARVSLGPYAMDTGPDGAYAFRQVPRGEFDLALDPAGLPADFAWDGRSRHLAVAPSTHTQVDLLVAPLNAIHGRVYCDRNGNHRFDEGEAVNGAVVHVDDRVTTTDASGAYHFYNLWPGRYVVQLDRSRLPAEYLAVAADDLTVALVDDHPVTGADFQVTPKSKPIIWREIK